MSDISIRRQGAAGRITLTRPAALNALTWDMARQIDAAVDDWATDEAIKLVVIDAEGDKAFCAGGDITDLYKSGMAGDFSSGRQFWAEEYRLNAKLAHYGKPIVVFMQGFTMGGGVGISCHSSHRVVGDSSRISMPECGIGLVPDVGGSLLLARAPGRTGEYLGLTGARMGPGDAIYCGFADHYVPEAEWPALIDALCETGQIDLPDTAPEAPLAAQQDAIDLAFRGADLEEIIAASEDKALTRNSPLSMACALQIIRRVRAADDIGFALGQEYRFTYRAMEEGDFLEGIRAQVIDKDRQPRWRYSTPADLPEAAVRAMLLPLGDSELNLED